MQTQKFDLIFISTFVEKDAVENLISSIIQSNTKIHLLLLIICQNGYLINIKNSNNVLVKTLLVPDMRSLSNARNLAINYIFEKKIEASHIMFPDDDSTFDSSFFEQYQSNVAKSVNYIVDIYCANTNLLFKKQKGVSGSFFSRSDWSVACSVNMLIAYDTFVEVGFFDENLGVGTCYGAGEDNDYFIRSCELSNGFVYNKRMYNFHPAPKQTYQQYSTKQLIRRFDSYGRGVIYCLCKHQMFKDAFFVCLRAFLGGIKSVLFLKLNYSIAYFSSFISRFSLFFFSILTYKLHKHK